MNKNKLASLFFLSLSVNLVAVSNCPKDAVIAWDNCFGTYVFDNGDKYTGNWVDNNMYGQGTYIFTNGDKYVGEWTAGEMNGYGIYTFANGALEQGTFINGKLILETSLNDGSKDNLKVGDSFPKDGEYIPLSWVQPIYPRRAQERGTQGYAIVSFTITETGTVENAEPVEGFCGDPSPESSADLRPCSIFNSASTRAAAKLKYKPKIVDGKATAVEGVLHRFTFIMADDD